MPAIKSSPRAHLLTALLIAGLPAAALSQTVAADAPLEAQATRRTSFDIPAQPLSQALTAFGRQSGLQIAVDSAAVAGKASAGVSGSMTADEALRQLLAGSGLTYQFTSGNAVTIAGGTRDYAGRSFCPRCGASVSARTGDEIEISLGSLDAADRLTPTYELWTVRRESWLPPFPLMRQYERDRDVTGRLEA